MRSLQARLSAGLIVALVVLLGVLLALGGYSLQQLAKEFVSSRLEHDMDALLAALSFDPQGLPSLKMSRLSPIFQQPYSGHYYKIQTDTLALRSRSLWDLDLDPPFVSTQTASRYFIDGPQGQRLLALARVFQVQGYTLSMTVAEDFTDMEAGLRRLNFVFALIALLLLAALIGAQRLIVRRGLQPLEDARQDILRLERGEISQLNTDAPYEIRPLVAEINRLINVMRQRQQRSRHALGNLAHALKGPLTMLIQLVERPEAGGPDQWRAELERQTDEIRLLMERELKRARIAGAANPGQRILIAEEVADVIDTLRKIYREKSIALECRIPPDTLFPGDRDDLLELLGNLLDNAWQWAANRVCLTVTEEGWLRITVEDDGPGCPPAELALLVRRGVRIDESRAGHGLGLAIVRAIVEQYGGRLRLDRSAGLGGFLAEVDLPYPGV